MVKSAYRGKNQDIKMVAKQDIKLFQKSDYYTLSHDNICNIVMWFEIFYFLFSTALFIYLINCMFLKKTSWNIAFSFFIIVNLYKSTGWLQTQVVNGSSLKV